MPRLDKPRLEPLTPEQVSGETRKMLERAGLEGRVLNIFRTLIHNPPLMKRWTPFANHILFKSSLPARDREILILRIGWLCQSEYEWGQHVVIGKREGLSDDDIRRIAAGPDAEGNSELETLLMEAADELHEDAFITDPTWNRLSRHYSSEQLVDLVFTVGQYNLVSMALNTLGVQLDEGVPTFAETTGGLSSPGAAPGKE